MAILPLQLARVSNALRTNLATRTISRTQAASLEVQNQLSTGKRLNLPSDDPGDSNAAIQLRKILEQRQAFSTNLQYAGSHLGEVDSSLSDLTDLLREAQTIASANAGTIVTASERQAAGVLVQRLYDQALSLANKQFRGAYLFAGDKSDKAPFTSESGGVRFVGSERTLENSFDEGTVLPFMTDGNEIFGALSTRVRGYADLSPALTADTRITDLSGATGQGVGPGSILLGNGSTSRIIDLSTADTVNDVIDAINNAAVGGITASLAPDGNSLLLSAGVADDITVNEVGGGTVARDLGIRLAAPAGAGVALNGQDVDPKLTALTPISALRNGAGIDTADGILLTSGLTTHAISFAGATTVADLLNAINSSGADVIARLNDAGTGIDVLNPTQGLALAIAENGGTTAADLGIRSFHAATPLSELNNGQGVRTQGGNDVRFVRRDGTSFEVDLDGAGTIQEVIDAINAADAGGGLAASFATTGNGLVLTDSTAGAGPIQVVAINASLAASDLGIAGSHASATVAGTDVNPVDTPGIFGNLKRLIDSLQTGDLPGITDAAERLQVDLDRVVSVRGQAAARVQDIERRQERLEDQNLATQALLSSVEDTDYNEAITRFQSLQTALQANLQTAGQLLNLSLLDFLR